MTHQLPEKIENMFCQNTVFLDTRAMSRHYYADNRIQNKLYYADNSAKFDVQ